MDTPELNKIIAAKALVDIAFSLREHDIQSNLHKGIDNIYSKIPNVDFYLPGAADLLDKAKKID